MSPHRDVRRARLLMGRHALPIAALVGPILAVVILRSYPDLDVLFESARFHLIVVSGISACALGVAVLAALAAGRTGQGSLVLLALGCLAVGAMMVAHGLLTPGVRGVAYSAWIGRTPVIAIVAFAAALGLAAWSPDGRVARAAGQRPRAVLATGGLLLAVLPVVAFVSPGVLPWPGELAAEAPVRWVLVVAAVVALVLTGREHWRRWRLGSDRVQLALVLAAWLSAAALVSLELGEVWRLSWWDYHAELLAGFGSAAAAIVLAYRRSAAVGEVLASAFSADTMHHIARGYSETLLALVAAVEARDSYTHGHSTRVAELSVRIGLRLGLSAEELRALAEGAYLHDVGKIGIPDRILNKPGPLTPVERRWVEEHPVLGVDIANRAPSLRAALAVIRHHHERFDGDGYPDGRAAADIPLIARIAAVADVWDALTSERAYRPAWTADRALAHLIAGRGTHFDPRCLDAFVEMKVEDGISPAREGDVAEALAAAEECHDHPAQVHVA